MYLRREKMFPSEINAEEIKSLKKEYGIRRMPEYFLQLLYAAHNMNLSEEEKDGLGIIYASHLGPIKQVHEYVNDLLTYAPEECSPAHFSHSVFNAPNAFLTKFLNINGASLSLCGFQQIIESAAQSAYAWLKNGYCKNVLVIYTDDISDMSSTINELTGVPLFQSTYLLLLSGEKSGQDETGYTYRQIIERVRQQYNCNES